MSFAFVQIMFIVCSVLDLCRVGSLETGDIVLNPASLDLCRVGSLENANKTENGFSLDLCRVGSLEIFQKQ